MFRTERSSATRPIREAVATGSLALVAALALSAGVHSASAAASTRTTVAPSHHAQTTKACKHRQMRRHGRRVVCRIPTPHPSGDPARPPASSATSPKPSWAVGGPTSRPGQLAARAASSVYDLYLPYPSWQVYYFHSCSSWTWSSTYRVWSYVCGWDNGLGYPFQHYYFRVFRSVNGVARPWFDIYDTPPVF